MGSHMKRAIGGSIHRIREFELEKVNLAEEFDILQIVGEGWFGKILLVEHRATDTEMVLKALPKAYTALRDFYREFHYGLHLSTHRNVITTYDVAFETAGFFVFSQEYAPLGDLTSNVTDNGIGELHTKRVARQIAAALDHLHVRELVHRDVKLDNILVFRSDFSRVKLCDFGETRRSGSIVRRRNEWLPYAPPEVLQIDTDDNYKANTSHDVWQFGIVIFVCLTGCLPWQKAALDDPRFQRFTTWHSSALSPIRKQPKLFKLVSSRAQRLFRKLLEPRPEKRPVGLTEVHRFLDDRWMAKGNSDKNSGTVNVEDDGLCPSMYSFHSSPEEKNKLLFTLTQYGIETTVDRAAKKDRIRAWIQNSVIAEEDETGEDQEDTARSTSTILTEEEEENITLHDNETGPAGERIHNRGPIEARRLSSSSKNTLSTNIEVKQEPIKSKFEPPRKHERRHRRKVTEDPQKNKVYTVPIDPTIPLSHQQTPSTSTNGPIPSSDQNMALYNTQRNPNAFLTDSNPSIPITPLPSKTQTNYMLNVPTSTSYMNHTHNQSNGNGINTKHITESSRDMYPYSTYQITSAQHNNYQQITTPNHPMNTQNNGGPISSSLRNVNLKNTEAVVPTQIKFNPNATLPVAGISNALVNSAMLAMSGVRLNQALEKTPEIIRPNISTQVEKRIISEKELDRNYNIYGIASNNTELNQKGPVNTATTFDSRTQRIDDKHVTFRATSQTSTDRSGSK